MMEEKQIFEMWRKNARDKKETSREREPTAKTRKTMKRSHSPPSQPFVIDEQLFTKLASVLTLNPKTFGSGQ